MLHFLVLGFALLLGVCVFVLGTFAPKEKWELQRELSGGKAGLYKRRVYRRRGKYERVFTTYAVLRNKHPERVWSFVWKIDRISRGGRTVGAGPDISIAEQANLHEVGFAPPLGLYVVYTGEEDHLSYPEREHYVLGLHKQTMSMHKEWRSDAAFGIRQWVARWRMAVLSFVVVGAGLALLVPVEVQAPQVLVWTLIGVMSLGLLVAIAAAVRSQHTAMWLQATGSALLVVCAVAVVLLPLGMLGANAIAFETLCEGSFPVERTWTVTPERGQPKHYADVTVPASCQFDARKAPIGQSLYQEFQSGRKEVDVVVSQGLLGYKRLVLIGS